MLFVAAIGNASGVDVERLINSFDGRHNQVEIANSFFKELKSQDFIDEDIVFTSSTPLDSVRQMFIIGPANGATTVRIMKMQSDMH